MAENRFLDPPNTPHLLFERHPSGVMDLSLLAIGGLTIQMIFNQPIFFFFPYLFSGLGAHPTRDSTLLHPLSLSLSAQRLKCSTTCLQKERKSQCGWIVEWRRRGGGVKFASQRILRKRIAILHVFATYRSMN